MQELLGLFPGLFLGRLLAIVFFLGPLGSLEHLLLLGVGHPIPTSDHESRKHNGMTRHLLRRAKYSSCPHVNAYALSFHCASSSDGQTQGQGGRRQVAVGALGNRGGQGRKR
ncbi:hypothetical protein FF1_009763 [Malus domestica]